MALAYTTGRVFIKGDGTPWRPLVHVQDVARSFIAVLNTPREAVHNEGFLVGNENENYRVRDIAEVVRQTVHGCHIEYAQQPSPDRRCCRADFRKITRVLSGFVPQWDIRRGAEELYRDSERTNLH